MSMRQNAESGAPIATSTADRTTAEWVTATV